MYAQQTTFVVIQHTQSATAYPEGNFRISPSIVMLHATLELCHATLLRNISQGEKVMLYALSHVATPPTVYCYARERISATAKESVYVLFASPSAGLF